MTRYSYRYRHVAYGEVVDLADGEEVASVNQAEGGGIFLVIQRRV